MENVESTVSLNFDVLLTSLLENKELLSCESNDDNILITESADSFGSWYEAD